MPDTENSEILEELNRIERKLDKILSLNTKIAKVLHLIPITEKEEKDSKEEEKNEMEDMMEQSNKMMSWMMPIMSVSISLVAPLGLALYWLVNNILMIGERLVLNKIIKD